MKAVQIERKWEGDNTKCHFPFISQKGAIQHTTEDNFHSCISADLGKVD